MTDPADQERHDKQNHVLRHLQVLFTAMSERDVQNVSLKFEARFELGNVDGKISDNYDDGGYVEGQARDEQTTTAPCDIVRNEDTDGNGVQPNCSHGTLHAKWCEHGAMHEWRSDGQTTVDTDCAKVPYGRSTEGKIHALPGFL